MSELSPPPNAAEITTSPPVLLSTRERVATLQFNKPKQFNTLSENTLDCLSAHLADIAANPAIAVVILASEGKAFCSGHDMKEMHANREQGFYERLLGKCSTMMQQITALPQPVIAQVQGIATAAGCQLVATCDLAVAAESASFATSGINNGLFCATPGVALGRAVSRKHALEMLFTGDFVSASRAAEIGLINRAVPDASLARETQALAQKIAAKSRYAIRLGKRSYYKQINEDLPTAYKFASADLVDNLLATDGIEGVNAFVEKRPPDWE
ncbi:MAG: enoyl-CoA hydratase [Gammaproteobacteria bacterium]